MARSAQLRRDTGETHIKLALVVDGGGKYQNYTGVGFLDHMLDLFARHGRFDLRIEAEGDTHVDFHHVVEDVGITLGKAFREALGELRGVARYGNFFMPMDETLVLAAVDLSGRGYLNFDVELPAQKVGDFDTELCKEFFIAFARQLGCTLHIKKFYGENSHHIIEAVFKGAARALAQAVAIDPAYGDEIPSTKGVLL